VKTLTYKSISTCFVLFLSASVFSTASLSLELADEMTVTLHTVDDEKIDIGKLEITSESDGYHYKFHLDDEKFEDEFLSMRPFKCMKNEKIMLCHLAYSYPNNKFISSGKLTDLEYDLLFLHKKSADYGIDAWNGLYYLLKESQNGVEGTLQEVDLNILAAPPEEGDLRPITADMLHPADPLHHWFPKLTIQ